MLFGSRLADDLELRLLEERHAAALFKVVDDDRQELRTWLPWVDHSRSAQDIAAFIRTTRADFAGGNGLTCGIWYREQVVGTIGLRISTEQRAGEIGYWVTGHARGHGIVTRSARALIDYGFEQLGLGRIVIQAGVGNRPSRAVAERLGLTLEGTLRNAEWVNDHYNDLASYAVLRSEWTRPARRHTG
jgi:ribosomal-protein-serine acetyltransferase